MRIFLKAQVASSLATATDFLVTILLKEVFHIYYVAAGALGTIAGGIFHFGLSRLWVFENKEDKVPTQAVKYILVWIGNLLLNAGGLYLVTHYGGVNYIISKISVSLIVGWCYNYLMHKHFVFKKK